MFNYALLLIIYAMFLCVNMLQQLYFFCFIQILMSVLGMSTTVTTKPCVLTRWAATSARVLMAIRVTDSNALVSVISCHI